MENLRLFLMIMALMSTCHIQVISQEKNDVESKCRIINNPGVDLSSFPKDADGYYILFDGVSMKGWRGYGKEFLPSYWSVDKGVIWFNGTKRRQTAAKERENVIFDYKFKNFELEFEWKISKGGNSGVFYLAQEVVTEKDGKIKYEPIYISAPEYQIIDDDNHPDAKLGKCGNRQTASLYDMIPAMNKKIWPFGEWNKSKIRVYEGTVTHSLNNIDVLEYHLWTSQWTDLLNTSKFSKEKWPLAFELLNNCGGSKKEGYVGFQDHGDDVWFRNIRIRILD